MLSLLRRGVPSAVVTILLATALTFGLLALTPGDPAAIASGEFATPETIAQTRAIMRLDESLAHRYVGFIGDAIHGNFGTSVQLQPGRSVWELAKQALPSTVSLGLVALLFGLVVGCAFGFLAALRPRSIIDRLVTAAAAVLVAVPPFVAGLALISLLAISRKWLPATSYVSIDQGIGEWFRHLILPAVTLGLVPAAEIARQLRGALVDVAEQDYMRTAVAKGLSRPSILFKHATKNAAPPVVTVFGLQIVRVIGGTIVVERIFAINGIGSLAVDAVTRRDLPVVQGLVVIIAAFVVVLNLLVDVVHASLVPRSR